MHVAESRVFRSLLLSAALVACGEATPSGVSRVFDDADASVTDAGGSPASLDGGLCEGGPATNVRGSRAPESLAEPGGPPPLRRVDGGFEFSTPTDPCVTYRRPDCAEPERAVFECPSVLTSNGGSVVHPGDSITVKVPITEQGLGAYSCMGIGTAQPLSGGSELFYGVSPGYVQITGQVPAATKPGTVYHFTAVASGSRYTSVAACEGDLTELDFDVTIE
ncbi:MAG TPA: hypothetical protein VHE30_20500 [Polyangiaceae bacterium]|nr:hypothetical protein [Polyangiaceae bacterium]